VHLLVAEARDARQVVVRVDDRLAAAAGCREVLFAVKPADEVRHDAATAAQQHERRDERDDEW
jgi:hypothetical protein